MQVWKLSIENTYLYDQMLAAFAEGWDACMHTNRRVAMEDAWDRSVARRDIHSIAHGLVDAAGWPVDGPEDMQEAFEDAGATQAPVEPANGSKAPSGLIGEI